MAGTFELFLKHGKMNSVLYRMHSWFSLYLVYGMEVTLLWKMLIHDDFIALDQEKFVYF
jgi:hypothetical protein